MMVILKNKRGAGGLIHIGGRAKRWALVKSDGKVGFGSKVRVAVGRLGIKGATQTWLNWGGAADVWWKLRGKTWNWGKRTELP